MVDVEVPEQTKLENDDRISGTKASKLDLDEPNNVLAESSQKIENEDTDYDRKELTNMNPKSTSNGNNNVENVPVSLESKAVNAEESSATHKDKSTEVDNGVIVPLHSEAQQEIPVDFSTKGADQDEVSVIDGTVKIMSETINMDNGQDASDPQATEAGMGANRRKKDLFKRLVFRTCSEISVVCSVQ